MKTINNFIKRKVWDFKSNREMRICMREYRKTGKTPQRTINKINNK